MKGKKIRRMLFNCSIQKKIFLIFLLIILILSVSGSIVVTFYLNTTYKEQLIQSAFNELKQVDDAIVKKVENYYHASYVIQKSEDMMKVLESKNNTSIEGQYRDMWKMNSVLETAILPFFIEPISVYVDDTMVYAGNNMTFCKMSELESYEEYEWLKNSAKPYIWLPKEDVFDGISKQEECVSFIRKIGNNTSPVGYMRVNIKTKDLQKELEKLINVDGEFAFLYGGRTKEIISSTDKNAAEAIYPQLLLKEGNGNNWEKIQDQNGKKYYICKEAVASTDWISVSVLPASKFLEGIFRLLLLWIILIVLVSGLALYLASKFAGGITRRLNMLEENMGRLSKGEFEKMEEEEGDDEISNLIRHYNKAINQMVMLYQNRYENMKKLKSAQLKILQSQINPHFLYNTLDLIHWEALEANAPRVSDITQALARFYRLSLNSGKEIVSMRDEINHVISYLELMNYKYKQMIHYEIELPEELYEYNIPKITLQPLIENAILHGLAERKELYGSEIEIYGWKEQEFIYLQIQDNGVGMSQQKIDSVLKKCESSEYEKNFLQHGYGIRNIHERLQLLYGTECGLEYKSTQGEGTAVIVKIKVV